MLTVNDIHNTQKIAQDLARRLPARIYALVGELGSGKTTFTQFFLRALGVEGSIISPTFLIIKSYTIRTSDVFICKKAYHIDCYRLDNPHELLALGFQEIISNPQNLVIIEWADRIQDLLPADAQWLYFEYGVTANERTIVTIL